MRSVVLYSFMCLSLFSFGCNDNGEESPFLPEPYLSSIYPDSGIRTERTRISISGSYFKSGMQIQFGSVTCENLQVISEYSATCEVPAYPTAGYVQVTIIGQDKSPLYFGFRFQDPRPAHISHVTPAIGYTDESTTITVTGHDFQPGVTLQIGSQYCRNLLYISAQQFTCSVPPSTSSGTVGISIANPGDPHLSTFFYFHYRFRLPPAPPNPETYISRPTGVSELPSCVPFGNPSLTLVELQSLQRQMRTDFEDIPSLLQASCAGLGRALAMNTVNPAFGFPESLTASFGDAVRKSAELIASGRLSGVNTTIEYGIPAVRYRLQTDFLTDANPYAFLEFGNSDIDRLADVTLADHAAVVDRVKGALTASLTGPFSDPANTTRTTVLDRNLSHMGENTPQSTRSATQERFRKRFQRLVLFIAAHHGGDLLPLALHFEGDTASHCSDGFNTQLNLAEDLFLGIHDDPVNFGDLISRVIQAYKRHFIQQHKNLFDTTEVSTYAPLGLMRRMNYSLGLGSSLDPLAYPGFFNLTTLTSGSVMQRLLLGESTATLPTVDFEALAPQKILTLLDQAARRGLSPRVADADRLAEPGIGVNFQWIAKQFATETTPPSRFRTRNPDLADRFNSDYVDKYGADPTLQPPNPDASVYFKMTRGNQTIPTEAFWTELLIHYGYVVRVP